MKKRVRRRRPDKAVVAERPRLRLLERISMRFDAVRRLEAFGRVIAARV